MANTDYGAIPLTLATAVSQKLNQKLGVTTGFKPSEWADAINLLGRLPNKTASGSICHFTDGVSLPLVNGKFGITAYQDGTGTPSPSNVRAIHGYTGMNIVRCGKNLWGGTLEAGAYSDADFNIASQNRVQKSLKIWLNAGTYTISWGGTAPMRIVRRLFDGGYVTSGVANITEFTFTVTTNAYVGLSFRREDSEDWVDVPVQIEASSSATSIKAYNGTTYPLTWQNECYGGYIDYKRGKKVTTHGYLQPTEIVSVGESGGVYCWVLTNGLDSVNDTSTIISSHFKAGWQVAEGNCYITGNGKILVAVPSDQTLNTKELADAWCATNKPQFVYKLANPIEEDITLPVISVLDGENNVWNTCGDSQVTYIASSAKTGINFSADVNSGWSATDATRTMMTITASGDAQVIFGKGATGITNCSNNHAYMKLIKNSTEVWTKTLPQNTTTKLDDIPDISLADGDQLKLVFGYASTHSNINMHFNNGYLQIAGNADVKGLAGVSNTYFSLIGIS